MANKYQRRVKPPEEMRREIIDMALREQGVKRRDVHNRFHGPNRAQAMGFFDAMVRSKTLIPAPGQNTPAYFASAQAAADRAQKLKALEYAGVAAGRGGLYCPSVTKLPGLRERFGAQPPPLPGGLIRGAAVPAPQPIKPRKPGEPIITVCPGWTHNHRYQLPPGARVHGEFSALGVGRYLDGAA